ncbi:MAG: LysM peptidoglycan-binding domain-containing protein [archaeon]
MKRGNIILIICILIVLLVSSVSALNACCEVTRDGEYCRYADESECASDSQAAYATCEQTSYCQTGCCYSSDSGLCYKNTAKARCEEEEGSTWVDSANCEIEQCDLGCCVLADQAFFVTEVKCKETASQFEDLEINFDNDIATEYECLESVKNQDWGCCVEGDDYEFTTRDNCGSASSEVTVDFVEEGFHQGMLCSNDLLSADCAKQQYTGCYEGKVYWYDSCGNRENIYDVDKTASFNDGYILEDGSCTLNSAYDSSCGNCDYPTGTVCGSDVGNDMPVGEFTCVDINCYDTYDDDVSPATGGDKLNGESWCVYDSFTGEARDAVGSRHYRYLCINGEEVVEPCTDFREQICIHGILSADVLGTLESLRLSDNNNYVEAACRENRNEDCDACNDLATEDEIISCCSNEDYRDCYFLEGEVARVERGTNIPLTKLQEENENLALDAVVGGTCVPQIPPGEKFWTDNGDADSASTSDVCNVATRECTATWRIGGWKKLFGGKGNPDAWSIVEESPEGCTERSWLVSQNTLCKAQGDCGAYYNYLGEAGFDGFTSDMLGEEFFFNYDELDSSDLDDWDYLINTGGGEIKYYGPKSRYFYTNPAFAVGIASFTAGGIANVVSCSEAKGAGLSTKFGDAGNSLQSILSFGSTAAGGAKALGLATGVDMVTGNAVVADDPCSIYDLYACNEQYNTFYICEEDDIGDKYWRIKEACGTSAYCDADLCSIGTSKDDCCIDLPEEEIVTEEDTTIPETKDLVPEQKKVVEEKPTEEKVAETIGNYIIQGGDSLSEIASKCGTTVDALQKSNPSITDVDKIVEGSRLNIPNFDDCKFGTTKSTVESAVGADKTLDFMEGIGCFLTGATPIVGLFGKPAGTTTEGWEDRVTEAAGDGATGIISSIKKAKGAKTVSRVSNVVTIAMAAYLAVEYLADNETTITYTAECNQWQPPKGGEDCELCNDENKPCSEYRCRSLGAACELINQGSENETCISTNVNDVNSPQLSVNLDLLSDDYTIKETTEEGNKGFILNELVPPFTPVQLGITSDEPATCKYATQPGLEYDEMSYTFGSELYLYNHALLMSLGDGVTIEEILALTNGEYTIYVRCSDYQGNANERDYFIRFTVEDTPDLSPPQIMFTSVNDGTYLAYNVNETSFAIYTNEPATCKWDLQDTSFNVMENEMSCVESSYQQSSIYYGTYPCSGTIKGENDELNYFYFKCQDREGNTNEDSFKFTLKSSDEELTISSMEPEGVLYNDSITVTVETDGGADSGVSECGFSMDTNDFQDMTLFLNTNSSKHSQELNLFTGDYTLYVTCQDVAGNMDSTSREVSVETDDKGPSIVNFYIDEAYYTLILETNEEAACEYATEPFTFGEGVEMSGTVVHEATIGQLLYYVTCEDTRGNQGSYILDISLWV